MAVNKYRVTIMYRYVIILYCKIIYINYIINYKYISIIAAKYLIKGVYHI